MSLFKEKGGEGMGKGGGEGGSEEREKEEKGNKKESSPKRIQGKLCYNLENDSCMHLFQNQLVRFSCRKEIQRETSKQFKTPSCLLLKQP